MVFFWKVGRQKGEIFLVFLKIPGGKDISFAKVILTRKAVMKACEPCRGNMVHDEKKGRQGRKR